MEFQTWFLAILDLKFSQQEAVLRGILESRPPIPPAALQFPRRVSMTEKHAKSPTSPRPLQVFEVKLDQEISPTEDDVERSSQVAESTSPKAALPQTLMFFSPKRPKLKVKCCRRFPKRIRLWQRRRSA